MLGKLMKYEWRGTYKVGLLLLACMAGATFFGWLGFQSPMWRAAFTDNYYLGFGPLDLLGLGTFFLYIIALVGVFYGMIIYLGVRFYRTTYTDEGYLLHTLPVTKHQILGSKLLVSSIWIIIVYVGLFLSVFALVASMVGTALAGEYTFWEVWTEVWGELGRLWGMADAEIRADVVWALVRGLGTLLITPFCTLMILYGAITLGQLFTKHRVLMAIVCYLGICIVKSIVSNVLQFFLTTALYSSGITEYSFVSGYLGSTWNVSFFLEVALAVLFYLVSHQIMSKKLNME